MNSTFQFFALILVLAIQNTSAQKVNLYIGTYTDGGSKGIYHYKFDTKTGSLQYIDVYGGIKNPSFLCLSPNKKNLYSVAEVDSFNGQKGGGVAAWKIEKSGKLVWLNDVSSVGASPCHAVVSPDGNKLVVSNYSGGNLAAFNILADGKISSLDQLIQHEGKGADPKRQPSPRTHSSRFSADSKYLFAADLGIDKLLIYRCDDKIAPSQQPFISMQPGAGPRHFVFSEGEGFIYVINELNSTVSVVKRTENGYKKVQDISTLPSDFAGTSYCADIRISSDGRFVYGSNRGHNSIAIFSRDTNSGLLTFIGTEPVRGDWPRNFNLAPDGNYLLVANQKSSNITVFRVNRESGKLTYTGTEIKLPKPVCLEFK